MFSSTNQVISIHSYDGQIVWEDKKHAMFEIGNFLGGGAAGTVYECEHIKSKERFALKILNPIGYKILSPNLIRKCTILYKGKVTSDLTDSIDNFTKESVWWLMYQNTRQYISAYYSEKFNCLKELSLDQCVKIWTSDPAEIYDIQDDNPNSNFEAVLLSTGQKIYVPKFPPKFVEFVRKRGRIFREIQNMRKISNHPNVIKLEGVLEQVQETKCTIFLVMELANGGELFDRIKVDCGTREETAKFFFQQLLDGVKHCHDQGVCHRDLKPENLLLQDTADQKTILKIADFGFSARFALSNDGQDWTSDVANSNQMGIQSYDAKFKDQNSPVRILKSIVGSPFYVAPEILQARGYDGSKSDIWSLGVILYAMLAGNLPFGQDLTSCRRFKTFCKWIRQYDLKASQLWSTELLDFPDWLFPSKFSNSSKGLIISMLHPDPLFRITVAEAMTHPLCVYHYQCNPTGSIDNYSVTDPNLDNSIIDMNLSDISHDGVRSDCDCVGDYDDESDLSGLKIGDKMSLLKQSKSDLSQRNEDIANNNDHDDISYQEPFDKQSGVFAMEEDSNISPDSNTDLSSFTTTDDNCFRMRVSPTTTPRSSSPIPCVIPTEMSQEFTSSSLFEATSRSLTTGIPLAVKPPTAPPLTTVTDDSIDDLFDFDKPLFPGLNKSNSTAPHSPVSPVSSAGHFSDNRVKCSSNVNYYNDDVNRIDLLPMSSRLSDNRSTVNDVVSNHPPSFNDSVKRSTRFITAVPAVQVLQTVAKIFEDCHEYKSVTPIGVIGRFNLDWNDYRLEVWGLDATSQPVFALQLYQLTAASAASYSSTPTQRNSSHYVNQQPSSIQSSSPLTFYPAVHLQTSYPSISSASPSFLSTSLTATLNSSSQDLYLVEFVRGTIEIFTFKRFYQWLRQKLSELVKKDYSLKQLEPYSSSPKVDCRYLQSMTS